MTSIDTPRIRSGASSAGFRALFDISSRLLRNRSLMLGRSKLLSYRASSEITGSPPISPEAHDPRDSPPPPWPEPPVNGLVDIDDDPSTLESRQRKRRDGWDEPAQRAFIPAPGQCGCIARCGMTHAGALRCQLCQLPVLREEARRAGVRSVRRLHELGGRRASRFSACPRPLGLAVFPSCSTRTNRIRTLFHRRGSAADHWRLNGGREHGSAAQSHRQRIGIARYGPAEGARSCARPDRSRIRQGLGNEARQPREDGGRDDLDRQPRARHRARRRRPAARPGDRDLRAGKLGQDDARAACDRRSAEESAAPRRSSMPSMRSIPATPRSSASTSTS